MISRELDFLRWLPVATNGVLIVTRVWFELTTSALRVLTLDQYTTPSLVFKIIKSKNRNDFGRCYRYACSQVTLKTDMRRLSYKLNVFYSLKNKCIKQSDVCYIMNPANTSYSLKSFFLPFTNNQKQYLIPFYHLSWLFSSSIVVTIPCC